MAELTLVCACVDFAEEITINESSRQINKSFDLRSSKLLLVSIHWYLIMRSTIRKLRLILSIRHHILGAKATKSPGYFPGQKEQNRAITSVLILVLAAFDN